MINGSLTSGEGLTDSSDISLMQYKGLTMSNLLNTLGVISLGVLMYSNETQNTIGITFSITVIILTIYGMKLNDQL